MSTVDPDADLAFEELDPDPPRFGDGLPGWLRGPGAWSGKRPPGATLVGAILLLNTISQVLYAGMLPMLSPVLPDPLPWLGPLLGGLALVAAIGVLRGLEWGRWLGMALAVSWSARSLALFESWALTPYEPGAPSLGLDIVLPIAVNAVIVLLLLFRWPRTAA